MTEAPDRADLVRADEIVRARPTCANCDAPMYGEFCAQCGQPKKGMIRHLTGILADFLDSVFNLDSRTLRTIGPLFYKPGHLSNEYFAGRRTRYVTPLRLYLFLSVIAFLAVSMTTHVQDDGDKDGRNVGIRLGDTPARAARPLQTLAQIDAAEKKALAEIEKSRGKLPDGAIEGMRAGAKAGFEGERRRAERRAEAKEGPGPNPDDLPKEARKPLEVTAENPNPFKASFFNSKPWHPVTNPLRVAWVGDTINAWLNAKVAALIVNGIEANKHPAKFVATMFSVAPQALFVVLPIFALLLKCFYLFKNRLYMEHLIVALHSHSFLCLSILLLVLLGGVREWTSTWPLIPSLLTFLIFATSCWIPIYLLIAQKRIYRQGWIMTTLKYFCIGFAYTVLLGFGIVLNLFWALAML